LSYNITHWNRQIKISKGFEWSKHLLNDMMLWASKYSEDEVIECALNKVDLHHLEQNDAPRIVELIALNEIDTALQRLETYGANDKEGLQRKFILYMLCLMELTLLESKDKPFSKDAIEKLLKHLDDNLPVDHSLLNWNDFFPSYLIFKMASKSQKSGIDFLPLYIRTSYWDGDWIALNGPYLLNELKVFEHMLKSQSNEIFFDLNTKLLIIECIKQNKIKLIKDFVFKLYTEDNRDEIICLIAKKLALKGDFKNSLIFIKLILDKSDKNICLIYLIEILLKQKKLKDAKNIYNLIESKYYRVVACCNISNYLFDEKNVNYLNPFNAAINISMDISNESWVLMSKRRIAAALIYQRKFTKAFSLIESTWQLNVNSESIKDFYLIDIAILFAKNKKYSLAEKIIEKITNSNEKNDAFNKLSIILMEFRRFNHSYKLFKKIDKVKNEDSLTEYKWDLILSKVSKKLSQKGEFKFAIKYSNQIESHKTKSETLLYISDEQLKYGLYKDAEKYRLKAFSSASNISDPFSRFKLQINIYSKGFDNEGKIQEMIDWAFAIDDDFFKDNALLEISIEMIRLNKINKSIECANKITDESHKSKWLISIVTKLVKMNKNLDVFTLFSKALEYPQGLNFEDNKRLKNSTLRELSFEFAKQGRVDNSINCVLKMTSQDIRFQTLKNLSIKFFNQGMSDVSHSVLEKALIEARGIIDEWDKSLALEAVATEYSKLGNNIIALNLFNEAIKTARNMEDEFMMDFFINQIAISIAKQGMVKEAIECSLSIQDLNEKVQVFIDIYKEFKKQGSDQSASLVLNTALGFIRKIDSEMKRSEFLSKISAEVFTENDSEFAESILKEAISYSLEIENDSEKSNLLSSIALAQLKHGEIEMAIATAKDIIDDPEKNIMLKEIATYFVKNGELEKAYYYANSIIDEYDKSKTFFEISNELLNQKQIEDSLDCTLRISNLEDKDSALYNISVEMAKVGNLVLAEKTGTKIVQLRNRYNCWKGIANTTFEQFGWDNAINYYINLHSQEIVNFYFKGLFENLRVLDCNTHTLIKALHFCKSDIESMDKILKKHSLHELFFTDVKSDKIQRFNRTLNIQWAIDIKND
jgi:hypothetical protein